MGLSLRWEVISRIWNFLIFPIELLLVWITDGGWVTAHSQSSRVAEFATPVGHVLTGHTVGWASLCLWIFDRLWCRPLLRCWMLVLVSTVWLSVMYVRSTWSFILSSSASWRISMLIICLGNFCWISIEISVDYILLCVVGSPLHRDRLAWQDGMLCWLLRDCAVYMLYLTHDISTSILSLKLAFGSWDCSFLLDILVEVLYFHSVLSFWDTINYCDIWHCLILLMQMDWFPLIGIVRALLCPFCCSLSLVEVVIGSEVFTSRLSRIICICIFSQLLLQPQFSQLIAHASMISNWRTFEILSCSGPSCFWLFDFLGWARMWSRSEVIDKLVHSAITMVSWVHHRLILLPISSRSSIII